MAISFFDVPTKLWVCVSTDAKPTADRRLALGDTIIENDTNKQYKWDGQSWILIGTGIGRM